MMVGTAILGFSCWIIVGLARHGTAWFRDPLLNWVFTGVRGKDPKSRIILAHLEEPVSMSFAEHTPLEDVLKYVKQATTSPTYAGIPIYVDPIGLQEAEKTMTSTVGNMELEGVPLRRTLQLLLSQLDLVYFVDDGALCITSKKSMDRFDLTAVHEPTPLILRAERAERGELSLTEMKDLIELFKIRAEFGKLAEADGEGPYNKRVGGSALEVQAPVPAERAPPRDVPVEKKDPDDAGPDRKQMSLLLKEIRELIKGLKAEKQAKNPAEGNEPVR
jgi:hypothetical protein